MRRGALGTETKGWPPLVGYRLGLLSSEFNSASAIEGQKHGIEENCPALDRKNADRGFLSGHAEDFMQYLIRLKVLARRVEKLRQYSLPSPNVSPSAKTRSERSFLEARPAAHSAAASLSRSC